MQVKVVESTLLTLLIKRNISFYWLLIPSGVFSKRITTFLQLFAESSRSNYSYPSIYLDKYHPAQGITYPVA